MSEAFATLATGFVHVMHNKSDYQSPPSDGIWARVEANAIFAGKTGVRRVRKLSEKDKSTVLAIWDHVEGFLLGDESLLLEKLDRLSEFVPDRLRSNERGELKRAVVGMGLEDEGGNTKTACSKPMVYSLPVDW